MARADHDPGEARSVEQAFLLVEIPAPRLLRHQPALETVGKTRDHVLKARHLLVEIGSKPAELLLVTQSGRFDDLVEAYRICLVISVGSEIRVAPARRCED